MTATSRHLAYELSAACFKAALIHLRLKSLEEKFDPNQPRVPAGHHDGGQWTDDPRFGGGALYRDQLLRRVQFTTNFSYACSKLGLNRHDASTALHDAKEVLDLRGDDNCVFDLDTGDILFGGEIIGNLGD